VTPSQRPLNLALCAAGLLAAALPALAQKTETATVQEVTITAQKVTGLASKTPVALSVITGDDLRDAGIITSTNLPDAMPNLQIGAAGFAVRGVQSQDSTEKGDPSAAFFLDGVYVPRWQDQALALFDIARVEVVRGPQGTLYGRNATAGAVNVITNKPGSKLTGLLNLELGNYNTRRFEGALTLPVSDMLSLRAALSVNKHDGYTPTSNGRRALDDQDTTAARLHGLLRFNPDTSLLVTVDASQVRGLGRAYVLRAQAVDANGVFTENRLQAPLADAHLKTDSDGIAAEFKTALGFADLTAQYSRRHPRDASVYYPGNNRTFDHTADAHEQQLEVRLSSPASASALQWVLGAYAFKEHGRVGLLLPDFFGPGVELNFVQNPYDSTSQAVFGQATFRLDQATRLTAGLRQTRDEKSRTGATIQGGVAQPGGNDAATAYSQTNWRLGIDHDLAKDLMIYGSVSTGYKAGGFNDGNITTKPTTLYYRPETLLAVESGLKGRFFGNALQLSAAVFAYQYKDMQVTSTVPNSATGQDTFNAAKASISGAELEGKWTVSSAGRVNFGLGLLRARYDDFTPKQGYNWAGYTLDRSPRTTLNLGYQHQFSLPDGSNITALLGTRYSASYVISRLSAPEQLTQPSYTKTDLTVTWNAASDAWYVQAYAKNIENRSVVVNETANRYWYGDPRTVGLRTGYRF